MKEMKEKEMEKNKKLMARYHRFFTSFIASAVPGRSLQFEVGKDGVVYTDHAKVHLGLGAVNARAETEFISICMFFLGHECQHVLSTVQKTWEACLSKGFILLAEEFEKRSGRSVKLDKEKAEKVFEKAGISPKLVKKFLHFVLNSIEDGRIERIRQERHPGFKKYRILFRGREWKENPLEVDEDMDARKEMLVLLNQIHSVCTTGLFQNGFLEAYDEDSSTYKLVADIVPDAWEMVQMNECRKAYMDKYLFIVKKLADPLLEGCKMTDFENMLSDAISKMMEQSGQSGKMPEGCKGKEEGGTGSNDEGGNIFGGNSASAVIQKRKQKKAERGSAEKPDEADSKDGSTSPTGKEHTDSKDGSTGKEEDSTELKGDAGPTGEEASGSKDGKDGSTGEEEVSNSMDGKDGNKEGQETTESMDEEMDGKNGIPEGSELSEGNHSHGNAEYKCDIEKAMEEAALAAKGAAEITRSTLKTTTAPAKGPEQIKTKDEIVEKMKEDHDVAFTERNRVYSVSDPLPDEIRARAVKCRRDTDILFQNKKRRKN